MKPKDPELHKANVVEWIWGGVKLTQCFGTGTMFFRNLLYKDRQLKTSITVLWFYQPQGCAVKQKLMLRQQWFRWSRCLPNSSIHVWAPSLSLRWVRASIYVTEVTGLH